MISKKLRTVFLMLVFIPIFSFADIITVKDSAPEIYVVKSGDTLWDISTLYLDKPWLWPELWRTNVHIINPHLIYPGDELRLVKNQQGELVLELVREPLKPVIKLSPQGEKLIKAAQAIPALPWAVLKPYIDNEMIMSQQAYDLHPYILGDQNGAVRFATDNLVLAKGLQSENKQVQIIRKQNEIYDLNGNFIGIQVRHLADARIIEVDAKEQNLLEILETNLEVKRGDRIIPMSSQPLAPVLIQAAQDQRGFIIDDLEQHNLLGKYNVVILDLTSSEIETGTILGIYSQGPSIIDGQRPRYKDEGSRLERFFNKDEDEIMQPALKVGEALVFKTFEKASYALITKSAKVIKRGMIVAKP
jgi:hypothetical protein